MGLNILYGRRSTMIQINAARLPPKLTGTAAHLICINPQTLQPPHSGVVPFLDESDDHDA
jgi:hypothetical protein